VNYDERIETLFAAVERLLEFDALTASKGTIDDA
jgi:hypothetical protein